MSTRLKYSESNHTFEDQFNQLPDEILVIILSCMTLKEAAQTSIISSRWKNLWTFTTGNLHFDSHTILLKIRKEKNLALLEKERKKYSMWVNQVLNLHKGTTIDGFKVCFDLDNTHKSNLNRWINFAIQKRATSVEVSLNRIFNNHKKDLYTFPKEVLEYSNMKFFRRLCLHYVDVSGPVLEDVLSKCPYLEELSVSGSTNLLGLKVCGASSLKLKIIEIKYCQRLEYFEVSAENLMSLVYSGPNISLSINHAPKLYRLFLGGCYCKSKFPSFAELSNFFSQIRTLGLDYSRGKIWELIPLEFPEFKILKGMELRVGTEDENSLLTCISLIKACPMLHKLRVVFVWCSSEHRPRMVEKREGDELLKCLKVVEFRYFAGRTTDAELAISILENAPYLEEIIVDTRKRSAARECAMQLAKKHSPKAKLLVL